MISDVLKRMRGGLIAPSSARGVLPHGQRVYAIGDIHGCAELLKKLLRRIEADTKGYNGEIKLVFVGDYINRGTASAEVIDLLMGLSQKFQTVFIKGNHEWAMQEFLKSYRPDWLSWGGDTTLASYDIPVFDAHHKPRPIDALAAELEEALVARGHTLFFSQLKLWHREGGYGFVHGGVRRGIPLEDQLESDLIFLRPQEFMGHDVPERIVFGHTVLPQPLVELDRIGIDTGAYQTGILTAVVLEEDTERFLCT